MKAHHWLVAVLVGLIIVAHIFLWRSDMPGPQKLTWTLLNALAWTVILAPIFLVDRWLASIKTRNRADQDTQG